MADPCVWIVCSICKAVHDAATSTAMWFLTDTTPTLTPVRGFVCGACVLVRHEAGYDVTTVDRRTEEGEPDA